jgi:hypothetical protein
MSSEIKIYKIKDLIRVNKKGVLDADRSIDTIHQLAATASFHSLIYLSQLLKMFFHCNEILHKD